MSVGVHLRMALLAAAWLGLSLGPSTALAWDMRSLAEAAVLYDAPSQQARAQFVIARGTPVEVVVSLADWLKVRDASGALAWLERRVLSDKRTVQVSVDRAQIRAAAQADAPLVFEAARDVVLELDPASIAARKTAAGAWLKVRHPDGSSGYVAVSQVWGA